MKNKQIEDLFSEIKSKQIAEEEFGSILLKAVDSRDYSKIRDLITSVASGHEEEVTEMTISMVAEKLIKEKHKIRTIKHPDVHSNVSRKKVREAVFEIMSEENQIPEANDSRIDPDK